jgi:hypothetical protein
MTQQKVAFSFFRKTVFSTMREKERENEEPEGHYRTSNPKNGISRQM